MTKNEEQQIKDLFSHVLAEMAKQKDANIRMGANLGFIEKIVLVDGTVLNNMHVLFNAPIPTTKQFEKIFTAANKESRKELGAANPGWSMHTDEPQEIFQYETEVEQ